MKETSTEMGLAELTKINKLSDHPHVATIKQAFETDTSWYFQFKYARVTLEEVLSVHTQLEERHICVIASSVSCPFTEQNDANILDLSCCQARLKRWISP
jgi:hypothetical protein